MYILQSLELVLYAALIPVAMGLAAAYIIYGRGRLPRLAWKQKLPKGLFGTSSTGWFLNDDMLERHSDQ